MKYIATINGKKYEVVVEQLDGYKSLDRNGVAAPVMPVLPQAAPAPAPAPAAAPAGASTIDAPMPGKILKVNVTPGQAVKYGDCVIIMEAMKMETEIVAQADGTIGQVLVKAGDMVDTGAALISMN